MKTEFEQQEKHARKTLDIMLKDYQRNPEREDLYKQCILDKIENLIDTYIDKGYDVTKQVIKYQNFERELKL